MDNWFPDELSWVEYDEDGYFKGVDRKWKCQRSQRVDKTFLEVLKYLDRLEKRVDYLEQLNLINPQGDKED
jgi:hypothetical protein